jgi:hypothetical protein
MFYFEILTLYFWTENALEDELNTFSQDLVKAEIQADFQMRF